MSSFRSAIVLGVLASMLGACSTQPPKASCEGHLTPINVPHRVGSAPHPTPRSAPAKSAGNEAGSAHGR